jgi:threonine dehydrogenase-like Zn-dependent dehydrogenase
MKPDTFYALLSIGVFVVVVAVGRFSPAILELLLALTRPGATVLLLAGVAYL